MSTDTQNAATHDTQITGGMKSSHASTRIERAAAWESNGTLAAANYLAWALREMSR